MNLIWVFPFASRPVAAPTAQPKPKYHRHPTPAELLAKEQPGKQQPGYRVAWDLTIRTFHAEISQHEIMVLATDGQGSCNVWVTVDIDDIPDILYCPSGSAILVKGEIASVRGQDIYLENCRVRV